MARWLDDHEEEYFLVWSDRAKEVRIVDKEENVKAIVLGFTFPASGVSTLVRYKSIPAEYARSAGIKLNYMGQIALADEDEQK